MTVTNCNEVTPLDELPKIPTLWEEDRKGEGGGGEVYSAWGRGGSRLKSCRLSCTGDSHLLQ